LLFHARPASMGANLVIESFKIEADTTSN